MIKKIDLSDILSFTGLACLSAGLYLSFGLNTTLIIIGALLFFIGIVSVIFGRN